MFDSADDFVYTFAMKPVLLFIVVFLIPLSSFAHPGKTDHEGGHKCWKNCGEWELGRGEYHLHDEEWNPVHIDRKGKVAEKAQTKGVPTPEKRFLLEENSGTAPGPAAVVQKSMERNTPEQRANAANQMPAVYEESFLPFNSILLLLLVLLLIVLIYVRKKREKG